MFLLVVFLITYGLSRSAARLMDQQQTFLRVMVTRPVLPVVRLLDVKVFLHLRVEPVVVSRQPQTQLFTT